MILRTMDEIKESANTSHVNLPLIKQHLTSMFLAIGAAAALADPLERFK